MPGGRFEVREFDMPVFACQPARQVILTRVRQGNPCQEVQVLEVLARRFKRSLELMEVKWARHAALACQPGSTGALGKLKLVGFVAGDRCKRSAIQCEVGLPAVEHTRALDPQRRIRAPPRRVLRRYD